MKKKLYKILSMAFILSIFCHGNLTFAQTMMPLPAHSSVYSGIYARGYWFTAPCNFTITGLKVAPEAGSGLQYIHVMKCNATFPVSTTGSTAFTTLSYTSGSANNTIVPVNISVSQGDQIGIMGTVTGICNSYGAGAASSTINGQSVYLNRFGYQGSIESAAAPNYWGVANAASGQIGRIYMYYITSQPTDAGLTTYVFPTDTICSGNRTVSVRLKNFGPNSLASVDINWRVNNVSQPTYNWSGTLASGDSTDVNIGSYNFIAATSDSIIAYTSTPNNAADTVNSNDTIIKTEILVNVSPTASVTPSGSIDICQNDSIILTANTGSGLSYQWMNNYININGETDSTLIVKQVGNYTVKITNSIGCSTISDTIVVNVLPIPPATASALGATTFCFGDSVFLMANPGSGLTYQWKRDGVNIPGATLTTMYASLGGAYTITTTHPNSCSNTSQPVIVTVFEPPINLGSDQNICPTHQITLDAGVGMDNYLWSTGDTTQTILVDSTGFGGIGKSKDYSVTVTQQSCTNSDTITITLIDCTGIPENLISFGINIYPNPSNGKINFDIPAGLNKLEITIYNTFGQKVYTEQITSQTKTLKTIDLSNVPKGVYFIGLKSKEKQNFVKVILN
ncbi:MAG: T9SS type A sorting domain-containing protein [Saprospiraceae bacterium]|nr:T9SS type A sorting domain-containing protein [Saprospiraceae bacterium]